MQTHLEQHASGEEAIDDPEPTLGELVSTIGEVNAHFGLGMVPGHAPAPPDSHVSVEAATGGAEGGSSADPVEPRVYGERKVSAEELDVYGDLLVRQLLQHLRDCQETIRRERLLREHLVAAADDDLKHELSARQQVAKYQRKHRAIAKQLTAIERAREVERVGWGRAFASFDADNRVLRQRLEVERIGHDATKAVLSALRDALRRQAALFGVDVEGAQAEPGETTTVIGAYARFAQRTLLKLLGEELPA